MLIKTSFVLLISALLCSCQKKQIEVHQVAPVASELSKEGDFTLSAAKHLIHGIPAKNEDGTFNAVIEIPTGTNQKWEVDKHDGKLKWEFKKGAPRIVDYLGYPGNYGFVPQSALPKELGGDGDPLDIIVLGPPLPRGAIIAVKPVAVLKLLDKSEQDDKIIAVIPHHEEKGFFKKAKGLGSLKKHYPGVTRILKAWFQNYKGPEKIKILGIEGKKETLRIIDAAIKGYQQKN